MITKHVRNREISLLNEGLSAIGALGGAQFSYGTAKTQAAIKKAVEGLKAARNNPPDFDKLLQEKVELQKKYALLDSEGKPTQAPFEEEWNAFVVDPTKYEEYMKEVETKVKKYVKAVAEQRNKRTENELLLDQYDDISVHTIKGSMVPEDITIAQAWSIILMFDTVADTVAKRPVRFNNLALMNYGETFAAIGDLHSDKLVNGMLRNMQVIYAKAQEIRYSKPVADFYDIYERQRFELCEAHAEKDEFGITKFTRKRQSNGRYQIDYVITDQKAFEAALEGLRKKHKKLLEAYEAFLLQEIDLDLDLISESVLSSSYNLNPSGEKVPVKSYQTSNIADFLE